jgi:hypothetical protein
VRLTGARLIKADGLKLTQAYVTPLVRTEEIGGWSEFPPTQLDADATANWHERKRLLGATVQPKETVGAVVALALDPGRSSGAADHLEVEYQEVGSSTHYTYEGVTAVRVRKKC